MHEETNKYSLDFLCWINRCLFKNDFYKELINLGIDQSIVVGLTGTLFLNGKEPNIVSLFQEHCLNEGDYRDAVLIFLSTNLTKWVSLN